ncbi:MAG: SHOCT domain-containing protein [Gemmatimonadaceae bacterium]
MGTNAAIPSDAATDRGVYDALEALRSMLIDGEELEAMAVQRRVFALAHRRRVVGATSGRVIFVQRNLFGGYTPVDFRWQDLRESEVKVGALGATLILSAYRSNDLAVNEGPPERLVIEGLRKKEAQEVYRVCQTRAQAWREKRRIRELEEMRARAGGIQLGALGGAAPAPVASGNGADNSPAARLQRAKQMRDEGLLSDAEFEQVKAKILTEL